MLRSRISFPFSLIFRFRNRRVAKENASSEPAEAPGRASLSKPSPPVHRHPVAWQPDPLTVDTISPLSTPQSSPICAHPLAELPTRATPTPIIVIESAVPAPSAPQTPTTTPTLAGHARSHIYLDGASLLESGCAQVNTPHVCFQIPTPHTVDFPLAESPLSPCSTLIVHDDDDREIAVTEAESPVAPGASGSGIGLAISTESDDVVQPDLGSGSKRNKERYKSLFNPQPVRVDMTRFSMPTTSRAAPNVMLMTNKRESRRESSRVSTLPIGSGRREKRQSRWSREMNKPETQEVLKALRGI